ncbi:hypothetical protein OF83DRAFT_384654 [Amylostereum chailletii]|nr:hypothetical protein OF83DRAFT_384654 [Amylostereum chailletii]
MILLEQEENQRPKLPSDPIHANVTNRPQVVDIDPESLRRPGRPSTSLPDYDTSQAQYRLFPVFRTKRRWLRFVWYAIAVYFLVVGVVAIPFIVLRSRSHAWRPHPPLFDPPLPLRVSNPAQIDLALSSDLEGHSCNPWVEDGSLQSLAASGRASSTFSFPLLDGVAMRANDASNWTDTFSGRLFVDVNTDDSVTNATLLVDVGYSRRKLLENLKFCRTETKNISAVTLDVSIS